MKVVLDTNVLVSGFLWQGTPEELFILAEKNLITICVTKETLTEFELVLSYSKFKQHLARIRKTSEEILDEFLEIAVGPAGENDRNPTVQNDQTCTRDQCYSHTDHPEIPRWYQFPYDLHLALLLGTIPRPVRPERKMI